MTPPGAYPFVPLSFERLSRKMQIRRGAEFEERLRSRRSVRHFSGRPVPRELVDAALRIASRAPSGANQQPWSFVLVSDPGIKLAIREAAEAEEREFYEHRAPNEWLEALAPLGTDWRKEFLEVAPYLIVVFRRDYGVVRMPGGAERKIKHYYVQESVGIACGFLIAALHWMGLATLTHTPSPMGFLSRILKRPPNEKPYLLLPVGYPADDAEVPDIRKRSLEESLYVFGEGGKEKPRRGT